MKYNGKIYLLSDSGTQNSLSNVFDDIPDLIDDIKDSETVNDVIAALKKSRNCDCNPTVAHDDAEETRFVMFDYRNTRYHIIVEKDCINKNQTGFDPQVYIGREIELSDDNYKSGIIENVDSLGWTIRITKDENCIYGEGNRIFIPHSCNKFTFVFKKK